MVLLFEEIDGWHPEFPWRDQDFERVLEALTLLAEQLTPSPLVAPSASIPGEQNYWELLSNEPTALVRLVGLDLWVRDNLDRLAKIAATTGLAFEGTTLLHSDIRADNILLTGDRVFFVDWPHATVGASWLDLLYFLPSVAMQGGPDPQAAFWSHPVADGARGGHRPLRACRDCGILHLRSYSTTAARSPDPPTVPAGPGDRSREVVAPDAPLVL